VIHRISLSSLLPRLRPSSRYSLDSRRGHYVAGNLVAHHTTLVIILSRIRYLRDDHLVGLVQSVRKGGDQIDMSGLTIDHDGLFQSTFQFRDTQVVRSHIPDIGQKLAPVDLSPRFQDLFQPFEEPSLLLR